MQSTLHSQRNFHPNHMMTGCDRNLVNCVNNIAQINTDCGPHPQLSPGGKKHENHHMSKCHTIIGSVFLFYL